MPPRTITDAMSVRIRALRADGKTLQAIVEIVEREFAKRVTPAGVKKHLDKLPVPVAPKRKRKAKPKRQRAQRSVAPPSPPSPVSEPSELDDLRDNARRLRAALAVATFARDITQLSGELRKTRIAIRMAEQAMANGAAEASQAAKQLRDHLLQFANDADQVPSGHASVGDVQGGSTEEPRSATGT